MVISIRFSTKSKKTEEEEGNRLIGLVCHILVCIALYMISIHYVFKRCFVHAYATKHQDCLQMILCWIENDY